MRELKFRAWDRENEKMILPDTYSSSYALMINEFGLCYKDGVLQDLILMQYIGIQDFEGNDIYEGDVVEVGNGLGEENCIVVYSEEECGFLLVNSEGISFGFKDYTLEIIGNIHQNKELIPKT